MSNEQEFGFCGISRQDIQNINAKLDKILLMKPVLDKLVQQNVSLLTTFSPGGFMAKTIADLTAQVAKTVASEDASAAALKQLITTQQELVQALKDAQAANDPVALETAINDLATHTDAMQVEVDAANAGTPTTQPLS